MASVNQISANQVNNTSANSVKKTNSSGSSSAINSTSIFSSSNNIFTNSKNTDITIDDDFLFGQKETEKDIDENTLFSDDTFENYVNTALNEVLNDVKQTEGILPNSSMVRTTGSNAASSLTSSSLTTQKDSSFKNTLAHDPNTAMIKEIAKNNNTLNNLVKDDTSDNRDIIEDLILENKDKGYNICDTIVAIAKGSDNNPNLLTDLNNLLGNGFKNNQDFKINPSDISSQFIDVISNEYEKMAKNGEINGKGNSLIEYLHQQTEDYIISQAGDNKALFKGYTGIGGNVDMNDLNTRMTLAEMRDNIDRFNAIIEKDPNFYDKYSQLKSGFDNTSYYEFFNRGEMIQAENNFIKENGINLEKKNVYSHEYENKIDDIYKRQEKFANFNEESYAKDLYGKDYSTLTKEEKEFAKNLYDYEATIYAYSTGSIEPLQIKNNDHLTDKIAKAFSNTGFVLSGDAAERNKLLYDSYQNLDYLKQLQSGEVNINGVKYTCPEDTAIIQKKLNDSQAEISKKFTAMEMSNTNSVNISKAITQATENIVKNTTEAAINAACPGLGTVAITLVNAAETFHDSAADGDSLNEAIIKTMVNAAINQTSNELKEITEDSKKLAQFLDSYDIPNSEKLAKTIREKIITTTANSTEKFIDKNVDKAFRA